MHLKLIKRRLIEQRLPKHINLLKPLPPRCPSLVHIRTDRINVTW